MPWRCEWPSWPNQRRSWPAARWSATSRHLAVGVVPAVGGGHPKWVPGDMVGLVQKRNSLASVPSIQDDLQDSNILDYPLESIYPLSFGCICACEGPVREGDILAGDPRKCWKSNSCCCDPGGNVLCCQAVQKVRRKVPNRPHFFVWWIRIWLDTIRNHNDIFDTEK